MDRDTIDGWNCAIGGAGDGIALSGGRLPAPVVPGVIDILDCGLPIDPTPPNRGGTIAAGVF